MNQSYYDPVIGIILSVSVTIILCCYCFILFCLKANNEQNVKPGGTRLLTRTPHITITINNPLSIVNHQIQPESI